MSRIGTYGTHQLLICESFRGHGSFLLAFHIVRGAPAVVGSEGITAQILPWPTSLERFKGITIRIERPYPTSPSTNRETLLPAPQLHHTVNPPPSSLQCRLLV
jgi:hypothetical protein